MSSATAAIPSGIDGVNPQWLTAVLRAHGTLPDTAKVTDVRANRIAEDTGFSASLYRLHLSGDGVPSSLIVKLPALSEARGAMEMMGGYTREVLFYRHVAGHAPLSTAHVYTAQIADGSTDFVLLLEDLQDWDNADHLVGLSLERTRLCIAQLAGLHAWSAAPGNADVAALFPSIDTQITREILPAVFGQGWQVFREKAQMSIPPAVTRYAERFAEHASAALRALAERQMLLHGDIRADNMFFADNRLKVVDFQLAAQGAGAADIGYLVSQGLPTAIRAGRDEELLREYLQLLAERGVRDYSFDDAWRHYRLAVGYLMVLPVVILVGWDTLSERSRQLCLTLTERAVAAIDDINATEVYR